MDWRARRIFAAVSVCAPYGTANGSTFSSNQALNGDRRRAVWRYESVDVLGNERFRRQN